MRTAAPVGLLLAVACGGPPARAPVDGPWNIAFYAADAGSDAGPLPCYLYGQRSGTFAGTWVLHEAGGRLVGQWDLCSSHVAGSDIAGTIDYAGGFDLNFAAGEFGIVEGAQTPGRLEGLVTGLGDGIVARGTRPGAPQAKQLPPPPDGLP